MNNLKEKIKRIPKAYFTIGDVRKISSNTPESIRVAMNRLVASGEVERLERGVYSREGSRVDWDLYACERYAPSYISFESALARHHILSQQPAHIVLATTNRTKESIAQGKEIFYRHIKKDLYWGWKRVDGYLLADAEKAFLDLLYFSLRGYAKFDSTEMNLRFLNKGRVREYARKFQILKMDEILRNLGF
ncbi:MAG: hypothetical protein WCG84_04830 [Candidatus Moraniibacteriota bacterium]